MEKSGNFNFSQGNLEKVVKVREKSGNLRIFKKSSLLKGFEKYNFYELQAFCGQEHYITN